MRAELDNNRLDCALSGLLFSADGDKVRAVSGADLDFWQGRQCPLVAQCRRLKFDLAARRGIELLLLLGLELRVVPHEVSLDFQEVDQLREVRDLHCAPKGALSL